MNAPLRGAWVNVGNLDANKIYAVLCCIAYWLDSIGHGQRFKESLKSLVSNYVQVDPTAMGFPEQWKSETLWQ